MVKTIKQEQLEVFFIDMEALGFNAEQTRDELVRLEACTTELDYVKASRVGATVGLNRATRKEVYASYSLWVA